VAVFRVFLEIFSDSVFQLPECHGAANALTSGPLGHQRVGSRFDISKAEPPQKRVIRPILAPSHSLLPSTSPLASAARATQGHSAKTIANATAKRAGVETISDALESGPRVASEIPISYGTRFSGIGKWACRRTSPDALPTPPRDEALRNIGPRPRR
jgi:hypothetical protein